MLEGMRKIKVLLKKVGRAYTQSTSKVNLAYISFNWMKNNLFEIILSQIFTFLSGSASSKLYSVVIKTQKNSLIVLGLL